MRGVMIFGKKGKLALRYIRPFMITERVGTVAYQFALSESLTHIHNVFHVSLLRKCIGNTTPVMNFSQITVL